MLAFDAFALVEDNECVESDSLTLGYSNEIISSGYGAVYMWFYPRIWSDGEKERRATYFLVHLFRESLTEI